MSSKVIDGLSVVASNEEKMLFYSQKALPESIAEISRNHENLTPVIEWLENAYLTSDNQPATQEARENEAKMYLTDALGAVVENINVIADPAQLDDLVNLQVDAVDGLTTQIQQIKTRLQVSKDQHGANRLRTLRTSVPQPSGEYTRKISLEEGSLPTSGARMESFQNLYAAPSSESFQRTSLQSRMNKYDNIGICLQKEAGPNTTAFSSSVYENSRRKSVPGTPGAMPPVPSPHATTPHSSMALGSPEGSSHHQSASFSAPPSAPETSSSAPPPSRPPPKLSTASAPPPPLSRRQTSSGGG